MPVNANGGAAPNAGFEASLNNEQQVNQFDNSAASWGSDMMSTIMNDVFGSSGNQGAASSPDAMHTGPVSQQQNELLKMAMQIGELFAELEQLAGQDGLGGGSQGAPGSSSSGGGAQPQTPEQIYADASGNSVGDPHQNFNGNAGGNLQTGHTDNMGSQSDLIDSNNSFAGGYQVATTATTPDKNGIAYNGSATISTNDGYAQVSMGSDGKVSVWDQGQYLNLDKGQSLTLSSGATVSEDKNGAVTVDDKNGAGEMSTTLSYNGHGVDVNFTAHDVALGGYDTTLGQPKAQPQMVG